MSGISKELAQGIASYYATITRLGGYGTRVRALTAGSNPQVVEGVLSEAGYGGWQPCVTTDDGRRWIVDIRTAQAVTVAEL